MDFPVSTPIQLRTIIRALRKSRGMTQAALGTRLGVNQKRIARIEAAPEVTSFHQITRYVLALGARLVIQEVSSETAKSASGMKKQKSTSSR